jgi:uncharacterized protein (TIGR03067 family)
MRYITFISLLVFGLGCASTKNTAMKQDQLNGDWITTQQELGGTVMPKAVLEKQKLTIRDTTYTLISESADKGVLKYGGGKMDIYGKDGASAGKHIPAIYKFENGLLTICYNLSGSGYPESFETRGKPMYFLSVWKKN